MSHWVSSNQQQRTYAAVRYVNVRSIERLNDGLVLTPKSLPHTVHLAIKKRNSDWNSHNTATRGRTAMRLQWSKSTTFSAVSNMMVAMQKNKQRGGEKESFYWGSVRTCPNVRTPHRERSNTQRKNRNFLWQFHTMLPTNSLTRLSKPIDLEVFVFNKYWSFDAKLISTL